jgi:hypothetical protein
MIKIRLDADYAYPSRLKSFIVTVLGIKRYKGTSESYLRNSKIIAKMINESPVEVKAYWFFTPYTIPDKELLELLVPEKHEIALHVAKRPYEELKSLEEATGRKLRHYTIHGTSRLLGKLIWKRKPWQSVVPIPDGFPLKNFYDYPNVSYDIVCYSSPTQEAVELARAYLKKGEILHVHPEWLFQRGTINHRGPFYEPLKILLETDKDLDGLVTRKKSFFKMAYFGGLSEYLEDHHPNYYFLTKITDRGPDVFTFLDRKWCNPLTNPPEQWRKEDDNIALLQIGTYDAWWQGISKKTRNMVRKAEKSCVKIEVVEPSEKLAEGIWKIYNETPFRQGRAFPHYGQSLESVKSVVLSSKSDTFIVATFNDEFIGFIQLVYGDNIAIISQILSLQQHWDKAVNNALVAKTVEICAAKNIQWVMYGRMGNHPSLDVFKENNHFKKQPLTRYYIPLTRKGKLALALKLHRSLKDSVPEPIKTRLFGAYNWVSRTKTKLHSK